MAAQAAEAAQQAVEVQREILEELRLIGKKVHCLEGRLDPGPDRLVRKRDFACTSLLDTQSWVIKYKTLYQTRIKNSKNLYIQGFSLSL